tara:strand:+ start:528 stop:1052 length:525 start_codon:yes stop_codon:yes gene_type:complete
VEIKDLIKKYSLNKSDVWECHGNWILTHDAITKISHKENISLDKIESIFQTETECRFLVTMTKEDVTSPMTITSVGEANKTNCQSKYLGSMAEKRGIDRCVLKLIKAYENGIYSEEEAEKFKKPESSMVTIKQKNMITNLCAKYKLKQYDYDVMTKEEASKIISDIQNSEQQLN